MNSFTSRKSISDFVHESLGRLTTDEVLGIVEPLAKKVSYICQTDSFGAAIAEIGLFSDIKKNNLIWIINFELLDENGNSFGSHLDTIIASIKVDDATGEILSVWQKGKKEEFGYEEFLELLETEDR